MIGKQNLVCILRNYVLHHYTTTVISDIFFFHIKGSGVFYSKCVLTEVLMRWWW